MNPSARGAERFPGFDVLRLGAAAAVLVSHSSTLVGGSEPTLYRFGGITFNLGSLAVAVFFVLSGFLISASWQAEPAARAFVTKRVFRIWPALILVVLVSAFVLGPVVTSLTADSYLTSHLTWHYVWANLSMHGMSYVLPGVFTDIPSIVVNAPLWTLPYEVLCYGLVLVLGLCRLLRRGPTIIGAFLLSLLVTTYATNSPDAVFHTIPGVLVVVGLLAVLTSWFLAGTLLQRYYRTVARVPHVVVAAIVLVALGWALNLAVLMIPGFAFLVVHAGTTIRVRLLPARVGDPSYGMYLWGWPIQQILVLVGAAGTSSVLLSAEALPLALLAGIASWYLVERRSIDLGRRLLRTRRRLDPAPAAGTVPAPIR